MRRPSPPNTYSYVQEENSGSTRKFVENHLLFTCITNKFLNYVPYTRGALMGWRNFSKTAEKRSSSPRTAGVKGGFDSDTEEQGESNGAIHSA